MKAGIIAAEVRDETELARVIQNLGLKQAPEGQAFIIKPPWFSPHPANFVGARELDLLLSCLPRGRRVVIEGYSGARNFGGRDITPENARENWDWIREQDELFRERTGINDVLRRHDAEYLNVTEEVWQGKTVPPALIRALVEGTYGAGPPGRDGAGRDGAGDAVVARAGAAGAAQAVALQAGAVQAAVAQEELFGVVPQGLYDLRGSVLISYAKLKSGSWTLKNLFGLIPDPLRFRWHGEQGETLGRSIIDISAIYRALFRVVGVVEGIYEIPLYHEGGRYHTDWGDYDIVKDPGLVLAGWPLVTLDFCAARLVGSEIGERSFARIGEAVFGEPAQVPPEMEAVLERHAAAFPRP